MLFCTTKSRVDQLRVLCVELMIGRLAFIRKFLVFCLFWIESVQWYVNDQNTVRTNDCLFS